MNRYQVKALREAVVERKRLRWCLFKREDKHQWNIARVTTKSKSETQTVSNDVSVEGRDGYFKECPNIGDLVE